MLGQPQRQCFVGSGHLSTLASQQRVWLQQAKGARLRAGVGAQHQCKMGEWSHHVQCTDSMQRMSLMLLWSARRQRGTGMRVKHRTQCVIVRPNSGFPSRRFDFPFGRRRSTRPALVQPTSRGMSAGESSRPSVTAMYRCMNEMLAHCRPFGAISHTVSAYYTVHTHLHASNTLQHGGVKAHRKHLPCLQMEALSYWRPALFRPAAGRPQACSPALAHKAVEMPSRNCRSLSFHQTPFRFSSHPRVQDR